MDPKQQSALDPKLQEAYDRVMGVAGSTQPSTQTQGVATPIIKETPPATPPPVQISPSTSPHEATTVVTPQPQVTLETSPVKPHAFVAKGNGKKISPVILAVGAIAFFVVYTIVWIKIFNLSVPFINQ